MENNAFEPEFENEHYIELCRTAELLLQAIAPYKYSSYVVGDSGFHLGNII